MTVWLRVMWDIMIKNNSRLHKNIFICQSGLGRQRQSSDGEVNLTDCGKSATAQAGLRLSETGSRLTGARPWFTCTLTARRSPCMGRLCCCCRALGRPVRVSVWSLAAAKSFPSRASAANVLQKLLFIQILSRRSVWGGGVQDERRLHILHVREVCTYMKPILLCFPFWKQSEQLHNPATLNVISHLEAWNQSPPPSETRNATLSLMFMSLHHKTMKQDQGAFRLRRN